MFRREECNVFYGTFALVLAPGLVSLLRTHAHLILSSSQVFFPFSHPFLSSCNSKCNPNFLRLVCPCVCHEQTQQVLHTKIIFSQLTSFSKKERQVKPLPSLRRRSVENSHEGWYKSSGKGVGTATSNSGDQPETLTPYCALEKEMTQVRKPASGNALTSEVFLLMSEGGSKIWFSKKKVKSVC